MRTNKPSIERLHALFEYDRETGEFRRRVLAGGKMPGAKAGFINSEGYAVIKVDGLAIKAHRMALAMTSGRWPSEEVDHINGIRSDNRLVNLRECTKAQNQQNLKGPRSKSASGLLGVSLDRGKAKQWTARIRANGKSLVLGHFVTKDEAHAAYLAAKARLHPYFVGTGSVVPSAQYRSDPPTGIT